MAEVRRRQTPGEKKSPTEQPVKGRPQPTSTGLPINALLVLGSLAAAGWLWYSGAFTSFTSNLPSVATKDHTTATPSSAPPPVQASSVGHTDLTDAELRAFDGSDPEKPLYVAIQGRIFDVSSGRNFYGPGGHYGHFAGRDATRAWVTECWDEEDQLTHDMRGVEEMFMPAYMDERLTDAVNGKGEPQPEALVEQAKVVIQKYGKVTNKERKRRRVEDMPNALEKVDETLAHWVNFFAGSGKYAEVGKVVREDGWEETAPPPPALCEKAKSKKPVKGGGKLDAIMNAPMKMGGDKAEQLGRDGGRAGEMPEHVKQKLAERNMKS